MTNLEILLNNQKDFNEALNKRLNEHGYATIEQVIYDMTGKTAFERMLDGTFGWKTDEQIVIASNKITKTQ